jgi:hypothetical protein
MPDSEVDAAARAAEEQRYQRWYKAARAYLEVKGVNPRGPGIHIEADELAHAFVWVANQEQDELREENRRLRAQLEGNSAPHSS